MRWRRGRSEQDFEEEIRSHIAHERDRLVAEGVGEEQAGARAERAFGDAGAAMSRFGATQPTAWLEDAWRDVVFALRMLRREPGFMAAAVLTLALGLGLNTSVFTLLYAVTLDMMSYEEYEAYRDGATTLEGLAAFAWVELTLDGDTPRPLRGLLVSCDYFGVLRARMVLGRGFTEDECSRPGGAPVIVLSDALWRGSFGGDPAVVGRTITLNRQPFIVIGVTEATFVGTELRRPALWLPLTMQPALEPDRLGART